jgi:hypothetical protein
MKIKSIIHNIFTSLIAIFILLLSFFTVYLFLTDGGL